MTSRRRVTSVVAIAGFAVIVTAGMLIKAPRVHAGEDGDDHDSRIRRGFEIAPVPLNLEGKNRALVGLGSYIVNAQGDCNGCHSADPATEFAPGGNPYFGQPTKINPATYLGGGRDFGPFPGPGPFPHIISRNLTPDKTGRPEGGNTFSRVCPDHKDRRRHGSPPSNLYRSPRRNLSAASVRWRSSPNNAMAHLSQHD